MGAEDQLSTIFALSGIPITPFRELIHQAVVSGWSQDELMFHVIQSPAFANAFPGILRDDGSLIMSPTEYRSTVDSFEHTAYLLGYSPSTQTIGGWIANSVSPQEVADRYTAANRVKEDPQVFQALQAEWKAAGLGQINEAGVANALLGQAPKQFYDIWERAQLRGSAANAGAPITHAEAVQIQQNAPTRLDEASTQQSFADLARQLRTTMPMSRLYAAHGLTRSDLITLEFGGPGQADIAIKAKRAMDTYSGSFTQTATTASPALSGAVRGSQSPQTA
jgi:hypothetical protein